MSEAPYYGLMRQGGFGYLECLAFAGMINRYVKRGELEDIVEFYKPEHILKLYHKGGVLNFNEMGNREELGNLLDAEKDEINRARLRLPGYLAVIGANAVGLITMGFSFASRIIGQRLVKGLPAKTEIMWEWSGVEKCQMVPRVDSEGDVSIEEECWVPNGRGDTYEPDEYHPTPHEHTTPATPDHYEDITEVYLKHPPLLAIGAAIGLAAIGLAYLRSRWLDYREDFVTIRKKRTIQMLDYFTALVINERFGQIDSAVKQLQEQRRQMPQQ